MGNCCGEMEHPMAFEYTAYSSNIFHAKNQEVTQSEYSPATPEQSI
jgi:hypothetical protein